MYLGQNLEFKTLASNAIRVFHVDFSSIFPVFLGKKNSQNVSGKAPTRYSHLVHNWICTTHGTCAVEILPHAVFGVASSHIDLKHVPS